MNQNVTASFGLSVLTVLFFAVILYQPEPPPASPAPDPDGVAAAEPVPIPVTGTASEPGPDDGRVPASEPLAVSEPIEPPAQVGVPAAAPVVVQERPYRRPEPSFPPALTPSLPPAPAPGAAAASVPGREAVVARPVSRRVPVPERPRAPRGAFTQSRAGESLADVARRVYGTPEAGVMLWRANRDVLDRADAPLRAGTLLRTP